MIFGPEVRRPIVGAARLKRGMIERIDVGPALGDEGDMQGPARRLALPDPEEWFETGAEADGSTVSSFFRRDLHHDADAERRERLQVELGRARDVTHMQADMIDHPLRSTICRFSEAIALAGFSPLGQALVQLRMVWQR